MNPAILDRSLESPELRALREKYEAAVPRVRALVDGLTDESLLWRPDADAWSIAQCIAHLNVTAEHFVPAFRTAIARGRDRTANTETKHGFLGRLFLGWLKPGGTKKFKAPGLFDPSPDLDPAQLQPEFERAQEEYVDCLHRADGLDLSRIRVTSPAVRFVRLPLGTWFAAHADHQLRHIEQAERVREHPSFPR